MLADSDLINSAQKQNLKYCSDSGPGFFRQKASRNFKYYDTLGHALNKKDLSRIKSLAIPPAWKNVWIAPTPNCHLQATGKDSRGRKQYIYHPGWIKLTQENKFDKMVDFGLSLPLIRGKIAYNLTRPSLDKEKILSTVVWLLEHTFIRVGNEEYTRDNNSFGLTTLRNRHVRVVGPKIYFSFKGKSGVHSSLQIYHPTVAKIIKKCTELPGFELFQYIDEDGNRRTVDSEEVNLFLKDITSNDFTAKDFRTWGGTSISANNFYSIGWVSDEREIKKNIMETVKKVSQHLNNTAAICRHYYIHPTVIETYQQNILVPHFKRYKDLPADRQDKRQNGLSWDEHALIQLLQKYT